MPPDVVFTPTHHVGSFIFDSSRTLGSTQLIHGFDTSTNPPTRVSALPVEAAHLESFLAHEGFVLSELSHNPHAALPRKVAAFEPYDGSHGFVVLPAFFGDLHSHVKTAASGIPERAAAFFFLQMVDAVAHCHSLNIVLRDVRLGKFLFADASRRRLCLADLRGAHQWKAGQAVPAQAGSAAYLAPELLAGNLANPLAADMWALGVVLHIMLTGRYVFYEQTPSELFRRIMHQEIALPDSLSADARSLLLALLNRDPARRVTAAECLRHPWLAPFASMAKSGAAAAAAAAPIAPLLPSAAAAAAAAAVEVNNSNNNNNNDNGKEAHQRIQRKRASDDDSIEEQVVPDACCAGKPRVAFNCSQAAASSSVSSSSLPAATPSRQAASGSGAGGKRFGGKSADVVVAVVAAADEMDDEDDNVSGDDNVGSRKRVCEMIGGDDDEFAVAQAVAEYEDQVPMATSSVSSSSPAGAASSALVC